MSTDEQRDGIATFLMIILILPTAILDGWVVSLMWRWFIAPVFRLPDLTVWTAAGLTYVVRYLDSSPSEKDDREPIFVIVYALVMPMIWLGLGAILHCVGRLPQ